MTTENPLENVLFARRVGRRAIDKAFAERNITLEAIADITLSSQSRYMPELRAEHIVKVIDTMLNKDEVQDVVQIAIALDQMAEQNQLPEPLNHKIKQDAGYFGVDESLVSGIYQLYGMVGVTNYGYIDKMKPSLIGVIDQIGKTTDKTTTFLDDVVGALAGGACGYFAHHQDMFYDDKAIEFGLNASVTDYA